jgi:hypothetical protein
MKDSARSAKIVEWSDEDRRYVGGAPGLVYGGRHGDDERQVFAELCEISSRRRSSSTSPTTNLCPRQFRPRSRQPPAIGGVNAAWRPGSC